MLVYGANTPLGSRTIVCRLHSSSSCSLMRVLMPSPKSVPSGRTIAARPPGFEQLHDEHEEQVGRLPGAEVGREVVLDPVLLHARRTGGFVRITSTGPSGRSRAAAGRACCRGGCRVGTSMPWTIMFVTQSRCGSGFFSTPRMLACSCAPVRRRSSTSPPHVLDRAGEEAAGAARRVEDVSPSCGFDHVDGELGGGPRRVELARVAGALKVLRICS